MDDSNTIMLNGTEGTIFLQTERSYRARNLFPTCFRFHLHRWNPWNQCNISIWNDIWLQYMAIGNETLVPSVPNTNGTGRTTPEPQFPLGGTTVRSFLVPFATYLLVMINNINININILLSKYIQCIGNYIQEITS